MGVGCVKTGFGHVRMMKTMLCGVCCLTLAILGCGPKASPPAPSGAVDGEAADVGEGAGVDVGAGADVGAGVGAGAAAHEQIGQAPGRWLLAGQYCRPK